MNWKDLAEKVGAFAPMLGGLLGGPAGAGIGSLIAATLGVGATPSEVSQALATSPDAAVKLRQIEADQRVQLEGLAVQAESNRLAAETAELASVNATMQAEAKSEHWAQWSWRPFCGYIFGIVFFGVYFVLPLAKLAVPVVPTEAWIAIGAVLGVASWHRGQMQVAQAKGA
jgi:alkylated DNA nucleotide flippase Atl1